MEKLNIEIDIATSQGRQIARELYGRKEVKLNNPIPVELVGKTRPVNEVYNKVVEKLKKHYGVE